MRRDPAAVDHAREDREVDPIEERIEAERGDRRQLHPEAEPRPLAMRSRIVAMAMRELLSRKGRSHEALDRRGGLAEAGGLEDRHVLVARADAHRFTAREQERGPQL